MVPKFSVLIANYNNSNFVSEALSSVLQQTVDDFEIVIVDDGSTDGSRDLLLRLGRSDDRIRLIYNSQNRGCGFTKKRLIDESRGDYCCFLDPDDSLRPNALEKISNVLEQGHQFVYSLMYEADSLMNIRELSSYSGDLKGEDFFSSSGNLSISHLAVFSRSLYNKTSGINPELKRAVDKDLYFKLEEYERAQHIPEPLYVYRRHDKGISSLSNSAKAKYWNSLVVKDTFERRKAKGFLPNISKDSCDKYYLDYLIFRLFDEHGLSKKSLYFICEYYRSGGRNLLAPFKALRASK